MGKKEIQTFQSDQFGKVRTVICDGEPWFVAADICRVLDLDDTGRATERLDADELTRIKIESGSQNREMIIVNEPGLYSLVLGSRKPEARAFKRWITHDVLPSIRKYGMYATSDIFSSPDTMAALVQALQHEQERSNRLQRRLNWLTSPSAQKVLEAERARQEDNGDDLPERAARLFVETINKMLDDGEVYVRLMDEPDKNVNTDDLIGFIDDDYLYAIPQKAYEAVIRHCRAEGDSFPISRSMLNRCLREFGIIDPDQRTGTATKPKWIEGRAKRLLWIFRDKMK